MVHQRLLGGFRVHERDVIRLNEILDQELPVRRYLPKVDGNQMVKLAEVKPVEPHDQRRNEVIKRRRVAAQVDENPVVPRRRPHRNQSVLLAVESVRHGARVAAAEIGREMQRAVQTVGPGVIGAADARSQAAGPVNELEAAVPAHVVKGPNPVFGVPDEEHRPASDGNRHGVAGAGNVVRKASEHPRIREETLALERKECLARVGRRRQPLRNRSHSLESRKNFSSQYRFQ